MVDVSAPVPHPTSSQWADGFGFSHSTNTRASGGSNGHVRFIRIASHPLVARRIRHIDPLLSAQRGASGAGQARALRASAKDGRLQARVGRLFIYFASFQTISMMSLQRISLNTSLDVCDGLNVVPEKNAVHTKLASGLDIGLTVIQEDDFSRLPAQALTGKGIDTRIGLGHADFV